MVELTGVFEIYILTKEQMEGYQKMMKALLQYQGKDGVWHQLIDHPESIPKPPALGCLLLQ